MPLPGAYFQVPEMVVADDESKVWLWTVARIGAVRELTIRAFDMPAGSQALAIPLPRSETVGRHPGSNEARVDVP